MSDPTTPPAVPAAPTIPSCLRCGVDFITHGGLRQHGACPGFVDDPAAPCCACGERYDAHPDGRCANRERFPYPFQAPAAYYCENAHCSWRAYWKPRERICPACGGRVWKDGSAGHKTRPALPPHAPSERCTICGSRRIQNRDGTYGACSLVPGRDGTGGCPCPLHDCDPAEHGRRCPVAHPPPAPSEKEESRSVAARVEEVQGALGRRSPTDAELAEMFEHSKNDYWIWVGSDIRILVAEVTSLRAALARMDSAHAKQAERAIAAEGKAEEYRASLLLAEQAIEYNQTVVLRAEARATAAERSLGEARGAMESMRAERDAAVKDAAEAERRAGVHAVRPVVWAFAHAMEAKLAIHDEKRGPRGWMGDKERGLARASPLYLVVRLRQEMLELQHVIERGEFGSRVLEESADVANMAMMIADVCEMPESARALSAPEPGKDQGGQP